MYLHTCINSSFGRCIFAAKTYCNPIMERLDEILEIVREIREDIAYMKRHRNMLCGTPILEVSEVCDLLKISDRQLRRYCRQRFSSPGSTSGASYVLRCRDKPFCRADRTRSAGSEKNLKTGSGTFNS